MNDSKDLDGSIRCPDCNVHMPRRTPTDVWHRKECPFGAQVDAEASADADELRVGPPIVRKPTATEREEFALVHPELDVDDYLTVSNEFVGPDGECWRQRAFVRRVGDLA